MLRRDDEWESSAEGIIAGDYFEVRDEAIEIKQHGGVNPADKEDLLFSPLKVREQFLN
jgi:hypothetical protein